ncbi:MAG: hypothetical protein QOI63_1153 [Thermoplasmata archaeon]|jgi:hypothetical protein|nr:hypothetical protein [Thermoplasmata archaeon]
MRASPALLAVAVLALLPALAGCAQMPLPQPMTVPPPPPPQVFTYQAQRCDGYLLGLVADPARTDPDLPPGFHLRDPADFFRDVLPTATGQALVVVTAVLCGGATLGAGTFQEAFAGIFVQPPAVDGNRTTAQYDFYGIDHLSPPGPLRTALAAWGWPVLAANLTARPVAPGGVPAQFTVSAAAPPLAFSFGGATPAPRDYGTSIVRLWRDTPAGVARVDYTLPLSLGFGPGTCFLGPATRAAAVVGPGTCSGVVATRLGFPLPATAVLESGQHAR